MSRATPRISREKFLFPLLALPLAALTGACGPGDEADGNFPPMEESGAASAIPRQVTDTFELRALHDSIDSHHDRLMARLGTLGTRMPDEATELYQAMEEMHGTTVDMHSRMMSQMHGDGMMGPGMMDSAMGPGWMHRAGEWNWQMETMHRQMSRYMSRQGFEDMAELHDRMAGFYDRARRSLEFGGEGGVEASPPTAEEGEVRGQVVYQRSCASCHGPEGRGRAGAFPPLVGSSWVTGDVETAARIVLHGLEGPIEVDGRTYDGTMPSFGARLSGREIAAVLSYARTSLADAGPVSAEEIASVRGEYSSRREPWTASELH